MTAGSFGLPLVSSDGVTWIEGSAAVPQSRYWEIAAESRSRVSLSGTSTTTAGGALYRFSAFPEGFESVIGPFLRSLVHGGGLYVGFEDGGDVYTSTDGLTYVVGPTTPILLAFESVFGLGEFVAVGTGRNGGATTAVRGDGTTFREVSLPSLGEVRDVTFDGVGFVFVGVDDQGANTMWRTIDFASWTTSAMGNDGTEPWHVATNGSNVVALSELGNIVRWVSDDGGMTWDAAPAFTTNDVGNLAFGNGRFVAVTTSGTAALSVDGGRTWNITLTNRAALRDVVFVE